MPGERKILLTRHKGGTKEHVVDIANPSPFPKPEPAADGVRPLHIPDLWHTSERLRKECRLEEAKMVLDVWSLCHELAQYIRDTAKPD